MAYAAWSVVFGEQPSAAKWNILGTNDASFNDGSGIGTNAIAAASLKTNAITLGYAQSTSNFSASPGAGTYADVTNLSVTVTVPSGSRNVEIDAFSPSIQTTAAAPNTLTWAIRENTTELNKTVFQLSTASYNFSGYCKAYIPAPSAGSHTYKVSMQVSAANTVQTIVSATAPAFILVKAI